MSGPSVALVILNWNGRSFLEKFLPSVMNTTYTNKRVVIADNASTDDSIAFIKKEYPQVELIVHNKNEGFAKGYNWALKQIKTDYYVLLNNDVEVTADWVEPIIKLMETDKKIAVCQPKLLSFADKTLFEYAGASGGWIDRFGYPFMRGRIFDTCEKDEGQYDTAVPCFWASGAALFVRASVYHELGGLDGYFFAHQEEIDFCWRAQLSGYKIFAEPASVVYHVGGGTLPKGNPKKVFLNYRNNLVMLAKNLPLREAGWKIPARFCLDALAAWKSLLAGDSGYFFAVARSHFHFFKWMLFEKRQTLFPSKRFPIHTGVYKGSVVWDYFARNKKRFSEIIGGN